MTTVTNVLLLWKNLPFQFVPQWFDKKLKLLHVIFLLRLKNAHIISHKTGTQKIQPYFLSLINIRLIKFIWISNGTEKKSLIDTINLSLLSEGFKNDMVHVARCLIGVSLILAIILSFSTWINRLQRRLNCQSDCLKGLSVIICARKSNIL